MRKMLLTPLIVCMVALLSVLSMPVHATPPTTAEGDWTYTPSPIEDRWADGILFRKGEEISTWTGTFDGSSYDVFTVVFHRNFVYVWGLIEFDGTVWVDGDGKSGSLVILFVGKKTVEWSGQWVILSGEGDLANLCGQGTWWGPPMDLDYSGKIHFELD